jgi:hypothetical protein
VSILPHLLEWGTHEPEEAVSKESWWKALLNTPSPLPAWLRCPSSFCLGDFLRWRWSEQRQLSGWRWGKDMFVTGCNGKKMEEQEQWSDGQGRRRNGRDARSRRRTQNQGRGGAEMLMGSLMLGVIGRNLLVERGGGQSLSRQ